MAGEPLQLDRGQVLGRPTILLAGLGGETQVWRGRGVVLLRRASLPGLELLLEAVDIHQGTPAPTGAFELPEGLAMHAGRLLGH